MRKNRNTNGTYLHLTDSELILLDGKCGKDTQKIVEKAKNRLAFVKLIPDHDPRIVSLYADLVRYAEENGELNFSTVNVQWCPVCHKTGSYKKTLLGETNLKKLNFFPAIEFAHTIVGNSINLGCCYKCFALLKPLLPKLADIRAEISEEITGIPPAYKRYDKYKCKKCGWSGGTNMMGFSPTFSGDGHYPSTCPKCGVKNTLLGENYLENANGFVLVKI